MAEIVSEKLFAYAGLDPIFLLNKKLAPGSISSSASKLHPALKMLKLGTENGPKLDFTLKMALPYEAPPHIVLVGCGGTGSHFLPNILQYVYARCQKTREKTPRITLIDGDEVETKNLVRQKFTQADLNMNKAAALAKRYSAAFAFKLNVFEGYLRDTDDLKKLIPDDGPTIIVGAVDNHRARAIIWDYVLRYDGYWPKYWVDAGNEGYHGQVVLGIRNGKNAAVNNPASQHWSQAQIGNNTIAPVDLPNFFDEYPSDFMFIGGTPPVPQNDCARMVEEDPQTIQANMMSAFCATQLCIQVLSREVTSTALFFDARTGNTKATFLTQKVLTEGIIRMVESRSQIRDFLNGLNVVPDPEFITRAYPYLNKIRGALVE